MGGRENERKEARGDGWMGGRENKRKEAREDGRKRELEEGRTGVRLRKGGKEDGRKGQ